MEEENVVAGAEPVDSGAAEAVAVESVEPVEAAEPAETVEAAPADPSLSAEPEPAPAPAPFPSAEEFGWTDWDGEHESLPETMQPWGQQFKRHYSEWADTQVADRLKAVERSEEIYKALMGGEDDPRLKEYQGQLEEWETKYNDLNTQYETAQKDTEQYRTTVQQSIESEAKRYADWFQRTNPDLFEDQNLAAIFGGLLNEGWEMETAAEASRLPVSQIQAAREAKGNGVPDSYAIRLAAGAKGAKPTPRPGAKITAGATTPSRSAETTAIEKRPSNLTDLRSSIAAKAIKQHANSKRR